MNSDIFAYESSSKNSMNHLIENPVEKKNIAEINDGNTGNYGPSIIKFDLSSLYNQNLFIDWNSPSSYLAIPIVTHLNLRQTNNGATTNSHRFQGKEAGDTIFNNYCLGYKNGSYQLIDNVSLKCGNNALSSGNNNLNILNNFKNLTIYSRESLENADIYNFYPDNHDSWSYVALDGVVSTSTQSNSVLKNNKMTKEKLDKGLIVDNNNGFFQRTKNLNSNISGGTIRNNIGSNLINTSTNDQSVDTVEMIDNYNIVYKNVFYVKLKDISDFFNKVGYSRFYCTMEIQLNIGSCEINYAAGTTGTALAESNILSITSSFQKQTCPFMISQLGEGLNIIPAGTATASTLKITNGICKVGNGSGGLSSPLSNTTLYVQTVQLKAKYEENLLSTKMKQIVFEDFYQADTLLTVGSSLNYIATNGIANLKYVLIVPFISANHNNKLSPLTSPFTSEPGTSSPCLNITGMQLLLAGERILPSEIKYNSRNYLENFYGCRSINGGRTDELSNGLINYQMYLNNYRYFYFDVSHLNNTAPRAITVVGKNESLVDIQLFVFAVYDKMVNLDIQSGEIRVQ